MESVKITISKELFEKLFNNESIKSGEYELHNVDILDYDYSYNEQWQELKRESTKAYKKLKELEFKIRNNER